MNENEIAFVKKIAEFADNCASEGNGPCHRIYVELQSLLRISGDIQAKPLIVDGIEISLMLTNYIKNSNFIDGIRQLRAETGIPLQAAKVIVDKIRAGEV